MICLDWVVLDWVWGWFGCVCYSDLVANVAVLCMVLVVLVFVDVILPKISEPNSSIMVGDISNNLNIMNIAIFTQNFSKVLQKCCMGIEIFCIGSPKIYVYLL